MSSMSDRYTYTTHITIHIYLKSGKTIIINQKQKQTSYCFLRINNFFKKKYNGLKNINLLFHIRKQP